MQVYLEWSAFKSNVSNKSLLRYIEREFYYTISYEEFDTSIGKTDPASSDQTDFETNYKSQSNKVIVQQVNVMSEPKAFASPDYRTKRSKTTSLVTAAMNTSTNVDYLLTVERYAQGGALCVWGAEQGDWVEGMIMDLDSVIPEAYRSALCEAWPIVATYVEGEWLHPANSGNVIHEINTYPLNAKISAGLYLRVIYHAANLGSDRKVGITYYLTKKLL
jgi:hypothetical protein